MRHSETVIATDLFGTAFGKMPIQNDRMMGVSGLAGDPAYPPRQPPMPPLPLGRTGTCYAQAMNRLGWHWWPSDTTIATTEYDGRAPCINVGHCTPGCAQGAKASTDITYSTAISAISDRSDDAEDSNLLELFTLLGGHQ
jgi:hypothetical protein